MASSASLVAPPAEAINIPGVIVCHFGETKEVNIIALPGHLGHGDTMGPCSSSSSSTSSVSSSESSHVSSVIQESSSSFMSSESSSDSSSSWPDSSSSSDQSSSSQDSSSVTSGSSASSEVSISSSDSSSSQSTSIGVNSSSVSSDVVVPPDTSGGVDNTHGDVFGGSHNGSCRKSQPWCKDGAKSGQYPEWRPKPDRPEGTGGGDSDTEHLCSKLQWMEYLKFHCFERVLSYGLIP